MLEARPTSACSDEQRECDPHAPTVTARVHDAAGKTRGRGTETHERRRRSEPRVRPQGAARDRQEARERRPGLRLVECAVIEPDLASIRKADKKLAETIERRCGRDLAIRSLAVFVARVEADRAKEGPDGRISGCSSLDIYTKSVRAAGVEAAPEVTALVERHAKACPQK